MQRSFLFNLIKNMQMSEKRYFSIYANRHSAKTENKNLRLFQIIDELGEDDNAEIIKQLKKEKINTNFLSSDKNYLFNSILKSLNEYHNSKTNSLIIKDLIISIEILFYKGLFNESLKIIKYAEKLAKDIDHLVLILEILTWKKRCIGYASGIERAYEVNQEIAYHTDLLSNFKEITLLYYDGYMLKLRNESKSKEVIQKDHKVILNHPLMKDEAQAKSFISKLYWYLIFIDYYFLLSDKDKEYEYLTKLIRHMESNSYYASENPLDYVSVYSRLFNNPVHKQSKKFFNSLDHLRQFPFKSQLSFSKDMISQRIFIITNIAELEWHIHFQKFAELEPKLEGITKELKTIITFIEPYYLIHFNYLLSLCLFSLGKSSMALDYVNYVLNHFKADNRPVFFSKIEVLNILLHVDLGNESLAGNLIAKLKRKKQDSIHPVEMKLLQAIDSEMKSKRKNKSPIREFIEETATDLLKSDDTLVSIFTWAQRYAGVSER